jgi:hypothetical protein
MDKFQISKMAKEILNKLIVSESREVVLKFKETGYEVLERGEFIKSLNELTEQDSMEIYHSRF